MMMQYLVQGPVQDDGTPPQVRSTVATMDEAARTLRTLAGVTEVRVVDDEHKEYGEGIQKRRTRGQDIERADPQMYLGGRPLNEEEAAELDQCAADLEDANRRFDLGLLPDPRKEANR
jgi:hypothetical protein